uniref:Uncharacterized protein n=1 Tax=Biomphalaria glabrata TaxID=6526 RepID=A0A2C9KNI1_BIOGL
MTLCVNGATDSFLRPKRSLEEEQKEKTFGVNKHFKPNEVQPTDANYKDDIMPSDASILCSRLGLNNKCQNYLETLTTKQKKHHNYLYYIVKFWEKIENDIQYDSSERLCKNLVSLGFTDIGAEAIAKNIPSELIDLQKPSYWAERYLENIFVSNPLLSDNPRYPYSETTTDRFFKEKILTENREEPNSDVPSFNINMLNCTSESSGNTKLVKDYLKKVQEEDKDSVLLYHGTTHNNAESILTCGITIGNGKDGQDLSSGDGFYLSEKLDDANKWSRAARGEKNAILVFKIKKDLIDASKENGLDLTKDEKKWQRTVKLCRTQYCDQKARKDLLKGITFLRGHMCLNPLDVVQEKDNPKGFGTSEIHICIRDEDYAVKFGSLENICCAIFY